MLTGLLLAAQAGFAQQQGSVSLHFLYEKLEENYPVASKVEVQQRITSLQQKLSQTGWFPEVTVGGSVSWQSEATTVPFPNTPEFSQDHYSMALEVRQPIFEAGKVAKLKTLNMVEGAAFQAGVEVEMNQLRSQLDQIYFGILHAQKQLEILDVHEKTLQEQLRQVNALVKNGVQLPGNQYVIEAELLRIHQQQMEVQQVVRSGFEVMEVLTGVALDESSTLNLPEITQPQLDEWKRPEFELFKQRQAILEAQQGLTGSDKLPVVSAFGKAAYGRPGFDAFNDDLHFFWMVGVKAQWSFRNWRNASKKSQVLELQKEQVQADERAFSQQLEASVRQQLAAINTLEEQIELDRQVLELRTKVVAEKQSQFKQGVITSTELVTELNAEHRARLDAELHKLQLVQANYKLHRLQGNIWY